MTTSIIWQNLISHRADVDPLELLPQEHNFRIHALNQRQVTTASLDELGHVGDIIVNVRTGKIVNGHLRVELAIAEDQRTVPVTYIDCDEATEKIILAFFDEVGRKAITDVDRLQSTLSQITPVSSHLQASLDDWVLGFKPKKVAKGKDEEEDDEDSDEDFLDLPAPEPVPAPAVIPTVAAPVAEAPAVAAAPEPVPAPAVIPTVAAPVAEAPAAPHVEGGPVASQPLPTVAEAQSELVTPAPAVIPTVVAAPVVEAPAAAAPGELPAVETPAPAAAPAVEILGVADEPAPAAVAPAAPPTPAPASVAAPAVVQDDLFAAAMVEDVRRAEAEEAGLPPPARVAPVVAAPSEYLVKVGEFNQMVSATLFVPWFAELCAKVGSGHAALSTEVKRRLGFE